MNDEITLEELHKEIDLIQGCIVRMSDNAFRLKEWYITLIAIALTILLGQQCELIFIGIFVLAVTCVFWGLDAYFLKMETLYRWKYEWVIKSRKDGEKNYLYDLNPHNRNMWICAEKKNENFIDFVFNKTLWPLYGLMMVIGTFLLIISVR